MKNMKARVLSESDFKAKCLVMPGEIEPTGEAITITKTRPSRGRARSCEVGPAEVPRRQLCRERANRGWHYKHRLVLGKREAEMGAVPAAPPAAGHPHSGSMAVRASKAL